MIISLTELKNYLNVSGTTNDTFYTQLINEATNYINNFVRYNVESGSRTIYFSSQSGCYLFLNDINVTAITTLKYKSLPTENYTTVSSAKYALQKIQGLQYLYCEDGYGYEINELVYTAGYSTIPDVIKNVAIEMVTMKIKESGLGKSQLGLAVQTETRNNVTETNQIQSLQNKWHNMLQPYKLMLI